MATLTEGLLEHALPVVQYHGLNTNKNVKVGGSATVDMSESSGIFKTPTGVNTFGGSANVFTVAPTGPTTRPITDSALVGATVVLTVAQSGQVFNNRATSGSPSWTLPTAANGLWYTFTVSSTTAGFTITGGTVHLKTNAAGTAINGTTITNTQATAVVGDTLTIVCDGTVWRMVAQSGVFGAA